MSQHEYLMAEIRGLEAMVSAAAFTVGVLRVLSTTEAQVWSERERLRRVREQAEELARALGLDAWPDPTDSSSDRSSVAGGGESL